MKTIKTISKTLMVIASLTTTTITATAQDKCSQHYRIGLNVTNYINGNGHGSLYNFGLALNTHRHTLTLGPSMQKATKSFTGAGLTYTFSVLGPNTSCHGGDEQYNEHEQLNFFFNVNYYSKTGLSTNTLNAEGKLSDEVMNSYKNMRLNTIEAFAGIGYNFWIGSSLNLRSFIGIGYYNHLNYNAPTYHDKGAVVLQTGIGIGFLK